MIFEKLALFLVIAAGLLQPVLAQPAVKVLFVDVRHRPPEMATSGEQIPGALPEIIEKAANRVGYKVTFKERWFNQSMQMLEKGEIDAVPRARKTEERSKKMDFLGPIGYQDVEIRFLVKPGREGLIQRYEDLYKIKVGAKKGSLYFEPYDSDKKIKRIESIDDDEMVRMFLKDECDTVVILDYPAMAESLKKNRVTEYALAKYRPIIRTEIHYGFRKGHKDKEALQKALDDMIKSGEMKKILEKYKAPITAGH